MTTKEQTLSRRAGIAEQMISQLQAQLDQKDLEAAALRAGIIALRRQLKIEQAEPNSLQDAPTDPSLLTAIAEED
jgi:hypothetical protein